MWKRRRKRIALTAAALGIAALACICSVQKLDHGKRSEIPYEIVKTSEIPEEMDEALREKMKEPFLVTYADKGWLYIAKGYGRQETGGYAIEVKSLAETENAIILETEFLGPEYGTEVSREPSFPFLVLKMKYSAKYVRTE